MQGRGTHRILIVEEDSLLGWSMANALKKAGYDADLVETADEGLRKIRGTDYDLAISDYNLPEMDGREFAIRLKTISRRTPLVMVTLHDEPGIDDLDQAEMVDYFVEKPVNLGRLVALVGSTLHPTPNAVGTRTPS